MLMVTCCDAAVLQEFTTHWERNAADGKIIMRIYINDRNIFSNC